MRLVYFEMRKSWLKIPVLFLLLLFILVDIYKLNRDFFINDAAAGSETLIRNSKHDLYQQILKGSVTPEKIEIIKTTGEALTKEVEGFAFSTEYDESRYTGYVFGDYRLFEGTLKSDFRYIVMYANSSNRVAQRAYENITFYETHGNIYEQRRNTKILSAYQGRSLNSYYLTQGSETFFRYDFSCLLALCFIIAVFCQSFSKEKEQGMKLLIDMSAGAESTVAAKCLSSGVFCAALSLVFGLVDLLTLNVMYHLDGLTQPIYSLRSFELSPFTASVGMMILYILMMRFVIYFLLSLVVMVISSLCRSSLLSLILSLSLIGGLVLLQERLSTFLNPVEMLSPQKYLSAFQCVNIADYPIYTVHASLLAYLLMSTCTAALLYFLNRRKNYASV